MTNVEHPNATVPDSVEVPRVGSARCGTSWVSGPQDLAGSSSTRWTSNARCRPVCGTTPQCGSISERDRSREDKPMIEVPANRRRNGHP